MRDPRLYDSISSTYERDDLAAAAGKGGPEAYLDAEVQQGMSWLAQLPPDVLAEGSARLAADLRSGEWDHRYGHLRGLSELDVGYRIVTAQS